MILLLPLRKKSPKLQIEAADTGIHIKNDDFVLTNTTQGVSGASWHKCRKPLKIKAFFNFKSKKCVLSTPTHRS